MHGKKRFFVLPSIFRNKNKRTKEDSEKNSGRKTLSATVKN